MDLISLLVWLAVLAIIVIAGWWILAQVNLPDPIRRIVLIVLVVVVAIIAISALLHLGGTSFNLKL